MVDSQGTGEPGPGGTESKLWDEDAEALEPKVEHLVSTMGKALRAFNMYRANNPVYQRFKSNLKEAFEAIWVVADRLTLAVTEDGFRYQDQVYSAKGRDDLAFVLHRDGVRNLTFLPGFEDEVSAFLDAVTPALRLDDDSVDLLTVLWEQDFAAMRYGYVDQFTEDLAIPDPESLGEQPAVDGGFVMAEDLLPEEEGADLIGEAAPPARMGLSRDDFDETLYFLDQSEMATLQTEVQREMERDVRVDVMNALFDRLEEPNPDRQDRILDILDQLLPLFLSRGDMRNAGRLLQELDTIQSQPGVLNGDLGERVDRLFERLSEIEVLGQFVQSVEDGAVSPESDEVNVFFSRLRAQALPILFRFAETSDSERVRTRLASAIDALATRYPGAVNELLRSDEPTIAAGAARVAGRVGLSQTVPGLESALKHGDREVRLAAVHALVAIRLTPALQALTEAVNDEDRDVRIAAAQGLGAVRFASARSALEEVIDGKRIRDADLTEKMAIFEAYGALGGRSAVQRLDDVLNSKGFLGRRNPTELRACAALGLGRAGTAEARQALERAQNDEDSVVRNAVLRALRRERVEQ